MAREIERKFLVVADDWRAQAAGSAAYTQGYLANSGTCSIRVRLADDEAWLNIKSAALDIQRTEFEYPIPRHDAEELLRGYCEGELIEKTRYFVAYDRHIWEVDVFGGANAGLVLAEIELEAVDEPFRRPPWVGAEVSADPRYYNVYLAHHPYSRW